MGIRGESGSEERQWERSKAAGTVVKTRHCGVLKQFSFMRWNLGIHPCRFAIQAGAHPCFGFLGRPALFQLHYTVVLAVALKEPNANLHRNIQRFIPTIIKIEEAGRQFTLAVISIVNPNKHGVENL